LFNPGFSGGTTESAWRRILETYPGRVEGTQEQAFAFYLGSERVEARLVRYRIRQGEVWESAAWPKVLLRDDQFEAIQAAIAPWLSQFLLEAPPGRRFAFDVPIEALDGRPAELRVEVAWDPQGGGILGWWLSERHFDPLQPGA